MRQTFLYNTKQELLTILHIYTTIKITNIKIKSKLTIAQLMFYYLPVASKVGEIQK
jgi:hypothetical protein